MSRSAATTGGDVTNIHRRRPRKGGLRLNQNEIYFSIVQRKALTLNDFGSLAHLARHLMDFGQHYRNIARPFQRTFTRQDLDRVLDKITDREPDLQLAAQRSEHTDASTSARSRAGLQRDRPAHDRRE